jgi:hypothetical protein
MTQHLCDLGQRGAVPNHLGRQTVAKQVGDASLVRTDARPLKGPSHDVVDRARA